MRDFPVYATEYGVASLILKEVPYRQEAYIIIQSALQPVELLKECISFCRMVGAEKIFARGHECVEAYPLHGSVLEMCGHVDVDENRVGHLWPVTEETGAKWREFLNRQLRSVDYAATLEKKDEKEILGMSGAYFVHDAGKFLGAGWIRDEELKLIASAEKGAGELVFHSLLSVGKPERIRLEVASSNERAIRFYEKMGLVKTREIYRWYQVL